MKIKIQRQYKSIKSACEFDLPEFSVLTGKNGSGKTHLLEAISDKELTEVRANNKVIENIRYIVFNGLNPKIQEECDPQIITQHIKNVWKKFSQAKQQAINFNRNKNRETKKEQVLQYIKEAHLKKHLLKTIDDTQKTYSEIEEDDLEDSFDISFMGQNDFFTAQFALIFKNYHKRQEENNINKYYETRGLNSEKPIYSDEEFVAKYGNPPWDFVNKILKETNIPYEVNNPLGTRKESSFTFRLKDVKEGFEIKSTDLSTGEKVLMSLALAIYNTGGDLGKPELLLIDEPDAALHPSMSQMMVNVLKKNIVTENHIPTIITTHSPTTVIASEGISIFQIERGINIPTSIPIQKAVELLSSGIPFLKISNDKRRQVFVESKYDVQYYEQLSNILARKEELPSEPIFIPARTSNGSNCTDVINVVTNLVSNGNEQVYGIIDWDLLNDSNDRIIVLGENERYSIENYLLDPLKMGLLFIRERKVNIDLFGGVSFATYAEVNKMNSVDAQKIIDRILTDLGLFTNNKIKYKLYNGWELELTKEFNEHQGHDLETLYKSKYPFLNSYHREDQLKMDIIEKVVNDYPEFTPSKLFETILKIK